MKSPIAFFLLASIGALCASVSLTSCKTLDDPSPHTEKVRDQNYHSDIMRRHSRRNNH